MKIKLKTLQQKEVEVDVEPSDNIAAVKDKVEKSQNIPAATQKLIFSGKILVDTQTISDIKINENDFMVLMTVKPRPGAKPSTSAQAATTPAASAQPPSQVAAPAARRTGATTGSSGAEPVTPSPAARTLTSQAPAANTQSAQSGLVPTQSQSVFGEEYETVISNMTNMGFQRDYCVAAMKAAQSNPDRAVEYLLNGIPEGALNMADGPAEAAGTGASQQQSAGAVPEGQTSGAQQPGALGNLFHQAQDIGEITPERLEAMRNSEQGRALRALVRSNPQMLEHVLTEMAAQQPRLAQAIHSNPQAISRLLFDDDNPQGPQTGGGAAHDMGDTNTQYIQVTAEEKAAIDRLQELGFPRENVIQAYFACDKNEENTANFLLEDANNDDMF
ncbi:UV excision repair protein rad23 [Coemansia sp. RSA 988]|nr:UV excision repair protein rad23 [Coemansia sp. RSA 988]